MSTLCRMTPSATQRSWINPEKARYYQVFLDQDLFGDWTLIKVWGGIGSHRGRMHSTGVASYKAGVELVALSGEAKDQLFVEAQRVLDTDGAGWRVYLGDLVMDNTLADLRKGPSETA